MGFYKWCEVVEYRDFQSGGVVVRLAIERRNMMVDFGGGKVEDLRVGVKVRRIWEVKYPERVCGKYIGIPTTLLHQGIGYTELDCGTFGPHSHPLDSALSVN